MRIEELDFQLPPGAIAQEPADPRDSCGLMHLDVSGRIGHLMFSDLPALLRPGDTLVFNDSKVLPARVLANRPSGGVVELLFLRPIAADDGDPGESWEALARPSKRLRTGAGVLVGGSERLTLAEKLGEGRWAVRGAAGASLLDVMESHGRLPLPPYIERYPEEPNVYQTVYAATPGSAAAPTAGLHFTRELIQRLEGMDVRVAWVTLHVGLDTFLPIRESAVEEHHIHTESFQVPATTVEKLREARADGRRVIAVGTTVTRVVETLARSGALASPPGQDQLCGSTSMFITPGYEFQAVDALLTNFHLPRSTVLALAMAFAGVERLKLAYMVAVEQKYRFFSFGDAMLIERPAAERV